MKTDSLAECSLIYEKMGIGNLAFNKSNQVENN